MLIAIWQAIGQFIPGFAIPDDTCWVGVKVSSVDGLTQVGQGGRAIKQEQVNAGATCPVFLFIRPSYTCRDVQLIGHIPGTVKIDGLRFRILRVTQD